MREWLEVNGYSDEGKPLDEAAVYVQTLASVGSSEAGLFAPPQIVRALMGPV